MIASAAVISAPSAKAQEATAETVATAEHARREMAVRDAMQQVQEARTDYAAKRYTDAVEHYRNALAVMPESDDTKKRIQFIKDSLSDALIARAIDYRSVGRYDEAESFLKEAISLSPNNQRAKVELVHTQDSVRNNPAITPEHVANVEEVNRLLTLGYAELDLGNYDKAMTAFEGVLSIDAYNTAARKGMENVQKRRATYYGTARDSARAKALADVDAQWAEPVQENETVEPLAEATVNETVLAEDSAEGQMAEALCQMVLPHVVFENANIIEVADALKQQIANFESQGVKASRKINITTNFGNQDSPGYQEIMNRKVQLDLQDVSVYELLGFLAQQVGISYYVTPLGVELAFSGKDFGPMVERVYTVAPHFFDAASENEGEDDEDEEDDDFGSSQNMSVSRISPAATLVSMGASFPKGAYARYTPSNRRLVVYNTPHNHEYIAELVNVPLPAAERAISLNITAVEVSEKDLQELGFEWLFNFHATGNAFVGGGVPMRIYDESGVPVDNFSNSTRRTIGIPSATQGLRSGVQYLSSNNMDQLIESGSAFNMQAHMAQKAKAPGILAFRGVWNSGDLSVIMRGLSQRKSVDLLYNPKLLFRPGTEKQVTFTNIREMFYPTSYTEPQIPDQARGAVPPAVAPSHPESFYRYGLAEDGTGIEGVGAIVKIHSAELVNEGDYVTLGLSVIVNEFEGFVNWGSPIYSGIVADKGRTVHRIQLSSNLILMPIFKSHYEHTKVTIAPGTVVVLGGLKEARTVKFEDKLPILGDLPFVGRFFRSEGTEQSRRAMIMFAKVDLVDPTGNDPRTGTQPTMSIDNF